MSLSREYITIFGPITAAIIAGSISFIITVLSKDQKTSEFRQAWIDSLRNEISELLSLADLYAGIVYSKRAANDDFDKIKEYLISRQDDLAKIDGLIIKIKLRLNKSEHKTLISMIEKLTDADMIASRKEYTEHIKETTIESQDILKKEWERVKAGEFSFRMIKWGSLGIAIFLLLFTAIYFSGKLTITFNF